MSKELVLITGVTGFLGTETARQFVDAGYPVRGTARSIAKTKEWGVFNPEYEGKIEWIIVEDIGAPQALGNALKDVVFVIHTAAPFQLNVTDNEKDLLVPAIQGTRNVLEAAKATPTVKHMVVTSSVASHFDLDKWLWPEHTYTPEDWNPATYEEAIKRDVGYAYCASKSLSERLLWEDKSHNFAITTISPPWIFGPTHAPIKSLNDLNTSIAFIWSLFNGKPSDPIPPTSLPWIGAVDVRDVAALHVKALTEPAAINARVLSAGFFAFTTDIAETSWKIFAGNQDALNRIPTAYGEDKRVPHYDIDSSRALQILGRPFISLEKCIKDTAERLWELESTLKN